MQKRWVVSVLWILATGMTCRAAVDAVTTAYNQCDNIAGTCLRDRQIGAAAAVQATSVVLALLCVGATVMSLRRPIPTKLLIGAIVAVAFSAAYLVLDPMTNLNNSRTGWLGR
jgi:hypothetical protein